MYAPYYGSLAYRDRYVPAARRAAFASKVGGWERSYANDIRTKQTFRDFKLHLEFQVPPSPAGTPCTRATSAGPCDSPAVEKPNLKKRLRVHYDNLS